MLAIQLWIKFILRARALSKTAMTIIHEIYSWKIPVCKGGQFQNIKNNEILKLLIRE